MYFQITRDSNHNNQSIIISNIFWMLLLLLVRCLHPITLYEIICINYHKIFFSSFQMKKSNAFFRAQFKKKKNNFFFQLYITCIIHSHMLRGNHHKETIWRRNPKDIKKILFKMKLLWNQLSLIVFYWPQKKKNFQA